MHGISRAFAIKCVRYNGTYCHVIEILISFGKSLTQLAEHPLYNTILAFLVKEVFSILFDEKYFVCRSIL